MINNMRGLLFCNKNIKFVSVMFRIKKDFNVSSPFVHPLTEDLLSIQSMHLRG